MHAHDWRVSRLEQAEKHQQAEHYRMAKAARRAKPQKKPAFKKGRSKTPVLPPQPVVLPPVRRVQHR
jgi:hypothetical protein